MPVVHNAEVHWGDTVAQSDERQEDVTVEPFGGLSIRVAIVWVSLKKVNLLLSFKHILRKRQGYSISFAPLIWKQQ